jgi:predicted dehydrogenase
MVRKQVTRRQFVGDVTKLGAGLMIVPRHVLGGVGFRAPSDTLNIAIVGAGGMGVSNAEQLGSENIVALCDVDFGYVDRQIAGRHETREGEPRPEGVRAQDQYRSARRWADFREMLERQRDIDAVVIATPDHTHAVIAAMAMRMGKHVYVQKPLTWSVQEARVLRNLARQHRVATQMGNQGHSGDDARLVNEWIQAGVIGDVSQVHVWTNRPIWPQGIPRPAASSERPASTGWGMRTINEATAAGIGGSYPVPAGLHWDLYVGPAQDVEYHPIYHPFNWRGWVDFGVGALGDMGAHLLDHPYWALGLGYPETIEATSTPFGGPRERLATYPMAMTAQYRFPARGALPPVKLNWYDGGLMPPRPDLLPDDVALNREGGVMYLGTKGMLMHETYGRNPRIWPEPLMEEARAVPQSFTRIETSHEMNWVQACKGQGAATSPFEYSGPLTEVMLLGIAALRAGQGRLIRYDGSRGTITNVPEANQYLTREYRAGWSL